jgi:hypothetical protein
LRFSFQEQTTKTSKTAKKSTKPHSKGLLKAVRLKGEGLKPGAMS